MQENKNRAKENNNNIQTDSKITDAAHNEAEKDMEKDPDLNTKPVPEADLDEGELAKLEGEE
ncbi:MAG: hypothetical protein WKF35_08085 [Ferruginibacter sp.]